MDIELTLDELRRCEYRRRLQTIGEDILTSPGVREAQTEAVIDALLAATLEEDGAAVVHVRHVGEWSARIAQQLNTGIEPVFARRVGVLSAVDPRILSRIDGVSSYADAVRDFQASVIGAKEPNEISLIVSVAHEFEERVTSELRRGGARLSAILTALIDDSCNQMRHMAIALSKSMRPVQNVKATNLRRYSVVE